MYTKRYIICILVIHLSLVCGNTDGETSERILWSPGRIVQVTLAMAESALLMFVLLFPSIMDPIVKFVSYAVGTSGSRRRRAVRDAITEHASSLHDLFLDALDKFEELDSALSLELY
ncbi:uncharacterized protein LOC135205665 [Macrobrachium nipponense]|uniref:uncharacterized protein LOC135205665 n=1 Tax=Macrobrachium nipponense TaxID=159736 RepID=UPI0030C7C4A0